MCVWSLFTEWWNLHSIGSQRIKHSIHRESPQWFQSPSSYSWALFSKHGVLVSPLPFSSGHLKRYLFTFLNPKDLDHLIWIYLLLVKRRRTRISIREHSIKCRRVTGYVATFVPTLVHVRSVPPLWQGVIGMAKEFGSCFYTCAPPIEEYFCVFSAATWLILHS